MHAQKKFVVTFTVSESSAGVDLERIFRGWSRVTSFGRTHFRKRVSTDEGLSVVTALNSLALEYELSIGKVRSMYADPSLLVLASTPSQSLKQPPGDGTAEPAPGRERRDAARMRMPFKWAVATFGLFLFVGFATTGIVEKKSAVPAFTGLVGLCEDDFTDNRYGWPTNGTADIHSGKYLIRNLDSDKGVLISNERLAGRSSVAEANVTLIEGSEGSFAGLAFRVRNSENFYFLGTALDGSVAIIKRELGFWHRLLPGGGVRRSAQEGSIRAQHRLKIVGKGIYMEFYMDGELLTVVRDESFEEGSFGFYVDRNLDAAFDDLFVAFYQYESFHPAGPLALR